MKIKFYLYIYYNCIQNIMLYIYVVSKKVRYSVHLKQGKSWASKCQSHCTAITDNSTSLPLASILTIQQWYKDTSWILVSANWYIPSINAASSTRWQCYETKYTHTPTSYKPARHIAFPSIAVGAQW